MAYKSGVLYLRNVRFCMAATDASQIYFPNLSDDTEPLKLEVREPAPIPAVGATLAISDIDFIPEFMAQNIITIPSRLVSLSVVVSIDPTAVAFTHLNFAVMAGAVPTGQTPSADAASLETLAIVSTSTVNPDLNRRVYKASTYTVSNTVLAVGTGVGLAAELGGGVSTTSPTIGVATMAFRSL